MDINQLKTDEFIPLGSSSGINGGRGYTSTRGIIIDKRNVSTRDINLSRAYYFQFNPETITDVKDVEYETRKYAGLSYVDYIWNGGGSRTFSFQLFLDNTPQSKTAYFRPTEYGSKLAQRIIPNSSPIAFEGNAFSPTRISERGILDEVDFLKSFQYAYQDDPNAQAVKFSSGGVIEDMQFRPPATAILCLGPLYFQGVIQSLNTTYTLYDEDLTPIRGTIDVSFSAFEFEQLERRL